MHSQSDGGIHVSGHSLHCQTLPHNGGTKLLTRVHCETKLQLTFWQNCSCFCARLNKQPIQPKLSPQVRITVTLVFVFKKPFKTQKFSQKIAAWHIVGHFFQIIILQTP